MKVQQVSAMTNQYQYSLTILSYHVFLDVAVITPMICSPFDFPVITFIAVDVEKKFTMILLVFVDKIAFLA